MRLDRRVKKLAESLYKQGDKALALRTERIAERIKTALLPKRVRRLKPEHPELEDLGSPEGGGTTWLRITMLNRAARDPNWIKYCRSHMATKTNSTTWDFSVLPHEDPLEALETIKKETGYNPTFYEILDHRIPNEQYNVSRGTLYASVALPNLSEAPEAQQALQGFSFITEPAAARAQKMISEDFRVKTYAFRDDLHGDTIEYSVLVDANPKKVKEIERWLESGKSGFFRVQHGYFWEGKPDIDTTKLLTHMKKMFPGRTLEVSEVPSKKSITIRIKLNNKEAVDPDPERLSRAFGVNKRHIKSKIESDGSGTYLVIKAKNVQFSAERLSTEKILNQIFNKKRADVLKTAIIRPCDKKDIDPNRPLEAQKVCLYSKRYPQRLLGRHPSEASAKKQEAVIQMRKKKASIVKRLERLGVKGYSEELEE